MCTDPSPQVRREIALSLRDVPAEKTKDIFITLAKNCDTKDKNSLEAIGLGAANQESQIWTAVKKGMKPGEPKDWPESFARLTWRLWGSASINDLKARCNDKSLALEKRKLALESIAFIDHADASKVMLEIASNQSPLKGQAIAWLLRNLTGEWAKHGISEGLKKKGIYDPDSITIVPAPIPVPPKDASSPKVKDILKLKGDPLKGKNTALRCILCHQIDGNGADYGPNLRGWSKTQTLEGIVRAIAEPSAGIALGYKGTEILLKDGGTIHGITFNNSDPWIKNVPPLIIQSAGGITQFIPNKRIDKKKDLTRSLMYDPVMLGLNAQDIADIAAWLKNYR
jgi:putative heme-binding domain-containing protein